MKDLTRVELSYLINLLGSTINGGWKSKNIENISARVDDIEKYFLQQKLEKLRDKL